VTLHDALPDLTLAECCGRWGVKSRNSVKARAAAVGVELRRESSTRTVWPSEHVALGDRLAKHLKDGGTLASFGQSVTPPTAGSDGEPSLSVMASTAATDKGKRSALTAATVGTDAMATLAQLVAAMSPPLPPVDPLGVARGLAEAADLGAWLSALELARLLGVAAGTVRGWDTGHRPRPGYVLERRKDGASVWWRVVAEPKKENFARQ